KHSDRARDGLTIDIQRTIVEADGTVREPERYLTRFKPWPNIYVFNPADLANGTPLIALPPEQPNLNTPSLTPDGGVRYISPEKTAPLAEAPQTPPTN
ncbi:MAG: hypothetical protein ACKO83_02990, partial [Roseiflexaceae bacterium]